MRFPVATLVAEEGLTGLLLRGLRRREIYRRFALAAGVDARRPRASPLPIECERLGPERIDEYLAFRSDRSRGVIRRRFDAGELCFVGRCDGRLVAATWACPGRARLEFLACEILLPDGFYYSHDTYVMPELRGRHVADAVGEFRRSFMHDAGYDRTVGLFEPENRVATQRGERRRNRVIGRVDCLRLGRWRRLRLRIDSGEVEKRWYRSRRRHRDQGLVTFSLPKNSPRLRGPSDTRTSASVPESLPWSR